MLAPDRVRAMAARRLKGDGFYVKNANLAVTRGATTTYPAAEADILARAATVGSSIVDDAKTGPNERCPNAGQGEGRDRVRVLSRTRT